MHVDCKFTNIILVCVIRKMKTCRYDKFYKPHQNLAKTEVYTHLSAKFKTLVGAITYSIQPNELHNGDI